MTVPEIPYKLTEPWSSNTLCFVLTDVCNLRCRYCFNATRSPHQLMHHMLALRILELFLQRSESGRNGRLPHLVFFGGEPTLNEKTLFAIMEYVREHGIDCVPRLVTNGIVKDALLERLIEEKFYFQVSFDGLNDRNRLYPDGSASTAKVLRTIRSIKASGLPLFLRCTVDNKNVHDMGEIVRYGAMLGADVIGFKPVVTCVSKCQIHQIQRPDVKAYLERFLEAVDIARQVGIHVYSAEVNEFQNSRRRSSPALVWLPDGALLYTIKYASSSEITSPETVVAGRLSENFVLFGENLDRMASNFQTNHARHCRACSAEPFCRGRRCFDLFCSRVEIDAYDPYECELSRLMFKELPKHLAENNQPY